MEENPNEKRGKKVNKEAEAERLARRKEKEEAWAQLQEEIKKHQEEEAKHRSMFPPEKEKKGLLSVAPKYSLLVGALLSVLISLIVFKILIPYSAPSLSDYNEAVGAIIESQLAQDDIITSLEDSVLDVGEFATSEDLLNYVGTSDFEQLRGRVYSIEGQLTSIEYESYTYDLLGAFGSYTLNVDSRSTGNLIARINLIYQPALGVGSVNATEDEARASFYSDYVTTLDKDYVPELVLSGNRWRVSRVSFYTSKFPVTAGNSTAVAIPFTGLSIIPSSSYVEVFKVM
jgi:hypothetical protein